MQVLEALRARPDAQLVWEDEVHAVFAARQPPAGATPAAERSTGLSGDADDPEADADAR